MTTRLWNFLTTDLSDLVAQGTAEHLPGTVSDHRAADAADVVVALAEVLAEESPNILRLASLANQLDSLLDAINAPLGKLMGAPRPFGDLGTGLLKVYGEATQKKTTLAQTVALVSQAAYLESFQDFAKKHPKVGQWLMAKDSTPQARTITLDVKALGLFELTEADARLAAQHFHQSTLAQAFNKALNARLVQLGATPEMATRMVEVVSKQTNRYLKTALAEAGDALRP